MLVLRHEAAFVADHGPAVLLGFGDGGGRGDEGFDRNDRIFPEAGVVVLVAVIGDFVGFFVETPADAVAGQVADDFVAAFFGFGFHQVADVRDLHAAFDAEYGLSQNVQRGVDQLLVVVQIRAQNKRTAVVGPKAVQFGGNVDVDEVTFGQETLVGGDAMAKFVVEADAGPTRKFVGQKGRGLGPEVLQDFPAKLVQLLGAHAGLGEFSHFPECGRNGFACLLHSDQFCRVGDGHGTSF